MNEEYLRSTNYRAQTDQHAEYSRRYKDQHLNKYGRDPYLQAPHTYLDYADAPTYQQLLHAADEKVSVRSVKLATLHKCVFTVTLTLNCVELVHST